MGKIKSAAMSALPVLNRARIAASARTIKGTSNRVVVGAALLRKVTFDIQGNNNLVTIADKSILRNVHIHIRGDGNRITIGSGTRFHRGSVLWLDSGSSVEIGERSTFESVHIAATEGKAITIGQDCMFATDIDVRTGDSHSLIDAATGDRLNAARDVSIGDHVWIAARALILKGVTLADDTVVAAGSIVTKGTNEAGTVLAGNPASTRRKGITWSRERL